MTGFRSDFVIITALVDPEFDQLKRAIQRLGGRIVRSEDDDGVFTGTIGSGKRQFRFYAAPQLFPGMVSSATLATKMIERYRPQFVVLLGIAAGIRQKGMEPGSVLIASYVADYQKGKTDKRGFHREGIGIPLDASLKGRLELSKDQIMAQVTDDVKQSGRPLRAYMGPIVTGNQVVASQDIMDGIQNSLRKAVGLEMEGFAIFQAAAEAPEPRPHAMLIKSVADFGTNAKNDKNQALASYTSADFFLRFAQQNLTPLGSNAPGPQALELMPWRYQQEREEARLAGLLGDCRKGSLVRFISITGGQFLDPQTSHSKAEGGDAFDDAIVRGVRFRGILLDPTSAEANVRAAVESPGKRAGRRLLVKHATSVMKRLDGMSDQWVDNLELRYSTVGLSFKLWLFKDIACIEPYHLGKQVRDRSKSESPLCGFSHVWIKRSTPEFAVLVDHFEQLWKRSKRAWP